MNNPNVKMPADSPKKTPEEQDAEKQTRRLDFALGAETRHLRIGQGGLNRNKGGENKQ